MKGHIRTSLTLSLQVKLLLSELSEVYLGGNMHKVRTSLEPTADTLEGVKRLADHEAVKQAIWDLDVYSMLAQAMLTGSSCDLSKAS